MNHRYTRSVWVSYASGQQDLVDKLGQAVKKATAAKTADYQLSAYVLEADSSEPQSQPQSQQKPKPDAPPWQRYLVGGEPVQLVVESIAASLRRVVVLSRDYLDSEYCLWELSSCLCYSPNNILLILDGIDKFAELTQAGGLNYYGNADTLAQALGQVYKIRASKMHDSFKLPADLVPADYFSAKLQALSQNVYLHQQDEQAETLAVELFKYADTIESSAEIEKFWTFVGQCFDEWSTAPLTSQLLPQLAVDQLITFAELKRYDKVKIKDLVATLIALYRSAAGAEQQANVLPLLYQFAAILALLRLDPEWVGEMRDANPGTQLLRITVPQSYDYDIRAVYEVCLAAHAIQLVPVTLTPGKAFIPDVGGLITMVPPPEAMTGENQKAQRKKTLKDELVSRIMDFPGAEVEEFLERRDWPMMFRAQLEVEDYLNAERLLIAARLYVDQKAFTKKASREWIEVARDIMLEINAGAGQDDRVNIGILQRLDKPDANIIYAKNEAHLQIHIENLLKVANVK